MNMKKRLFQTSGPACIRLVGLCLLFLGHAPRATALIAVADQARTEQNTSVEINVLANDSAATNQMAILRVTSPAHGTVVSHSNQLATRTELAALFQFAAVQLSNTVVQLGDTNLYPRSTLPNGTWDTRSAQDWTAGFFPGALWFVYEATGDPHFRTWAENWTAGLAAQQYVTETDDLGFMINNSFGAGYRLTGNPVYLPVLLHAAQSVVAVRYSPVVGCVGDTLVDGTFVVINDSLMNMELLYHAAALGGNKSFFTNAFTEAETTMANQVRPDGSTWHGVIYNPTNGAVLNKGWRAAESPDSTWARGQAWSTYGFAMAFRETGDPRFLNTAQRLADYYLTNAPPDHVPYWDYQAPDIPNALRDSSSAAITLSALLELSQEATNSQDCARYWQAARQLFDSLTSSNYLARGSTSSGILLHGTGYPGDEADLSLIYGDYYFIESLKRYNDRYHHTTLTYVPDPNYSGADSFTYQVGDSSGAAATATVNISVGIFVQISLAPATGRPTLSFPTMTNRNYFVQSADTLAPPVFWNSLATNLPGTGALISVTDTNPPARRFYRMGVQ